ncbi:MULTISPECIES: hypothetical protein [Nonlabens]|uniref:DUF4258 domain-containing protein n=1 Tax=Nonlabens xylanidelens TaxID=191564 RepID=A0A2S6IMZ9_9FLAO|nr:hypothetical protein [Nonlabens xylanidelens]PPK95632.1 hypothetical protein LY01_01223 [Nonlabens xylanidelens]PQJ22434.1 hypothetical protein BST94_02350 [Nonlabens xylanidelens]
MKFIQRLGFYGGGFAIGIVFLLFFLTGKRTQCTWLPEDRVINDIRKKNAIRFSPEIRTMLTDRKLDTLTIQLILKYGKVDFSKSNTDTIPCNFYHISGREELANTSLWVRNCERFVRVEKVLSQ